MAEEPRDGAVTMSVPLDELNQETERRFVLMLPIISVDIEGELGRAQYAGPVAVRSFGARFRRACRVASRTMAAAEGTGWRRPERPDWDTCNVMLEKWSRPRAAAAEVRKLPHQRALQLMTVVHGEFVRVELGQRG
jgi:hypothetical protein